MVALIYSTYIPLSGLRKSNITPESKERNQQQDHGKLIKTLIRSGNAFNISFKSNPARDKSLLLAITSSFITSSFPYPSPLFSVTHQMALSSYL
jgi:hypothetical protein